MLDQPQTYLFVPGNRPERFAKALASGADRVILDLEDAVAPGDKATARQAVTQWMAQANEIALSQVLIRINAGDPDDLALLHSVQARCVMLPKCEAPGQVADVLAHMPAGAGVVALVESARGLLALADVAAAPGVIRLAFGSLDYMVDLDLPALSSTSMALDHAAAHIAVVSRAAGLPSPVAGVTPAIDAGQVAEDMLHARSLGFGAKMCIHPTQIAAVCAALAPTAADLAWAERVLQAAQVGGAGAVQLDGKMVDRPVVLKAQRILAQAARKPSTTP